MGGRPAADPRRAADAAPWWVHAGFFEAGAIVRRGFRAPLQQEDMARLTDCQTRQLYEDVWRAWDRERAVSQPGARVPLARVLLKVYRGPLLLGAFLHLLVNLTTFVGPTVLPLIVSGVQCRDLAGPDAADGLCASQAQLYYYALLLFLAPSVALICESHYNYLMRKTGTQARNALMGGVYRKCLKLDNAATQRQSTGKIVTLMSNDCQKMQDVTYMLNSLWACPLLIIGIVAYLYTVVEWAAFIGLLVMFMMGPLAGVLAVKLAGLRKELLPYVDKRVGLISEVVQGIRVIKYYAWERPFKERIREWREKEGSVLRRQSVLFAWFGVSLFGGPVFVGIISFAAYAGAGNTFTVAQVYQAVALFSMLRFPLSFLPQFLAQVTAALVSLKRVEGFLAETQFDDDDNEGASAGLPAGHISMEGASLGWTVREQAPAKIDDAEGGAGAGAEADAAAGGGDPAVTGKEEEGSPAARGPKQGGGGKAGGGGRRAPKKGRGKSPAEEPERPLLFKQVLADVNFEVPQGKLTIVFGKVGSGKSTLLNAIMKLATVKEGQVRVGGRVAYTAQTPWIKNASLRENILFNAPFDPERYDDALAVSQLRPDLLVLPRGDNTEIGEQGVNLSGGQKHRVAIARAVYSDSDVYLLDDPMAALDAQVGQSVFLDCVKGALSGKTVVLVTNALQYLTQADHILWVDEGAVRYAGDYGGLLAAGVDLEVVAGVEAGDTEAGGEAKGGKDAEPEKKPRGPAENKKELTGVEERESGAVAGRVYHLYMLAAGGWPAVIQVCFCFLLEAGLRAGTDAWVGVWANGEGGLEVWAYILAYFALGIGFSAAVGIRSYTLLYKMVTASLKLHNDLLLHVMRLPIMFFDTNPSGRIVNRFSRDMEIIDSTLNASIIQLMGCMSNVMITVVMVTVAAAASPTPYVVVGWLPIVALYVLIQRYFVPTSRETQRLESISRSPIYAHFGESVTGIKTIQAFHRQKKFIAISDELMDVNAAAYMTKTLATEWLNMRLDFVGMLIAGMAAFLAASGGVGVVFTGLILTYALEVPKFLKFGTMMAARVESEFNSVERVVQYLKVDTEADEDTPPEVKKALPATFASKSTLAFRNYSMRYRDGLPLVLKDVSFTIADGEKIGIVGRTGSGKSSILVSIFRMVEGSSGSILLNGVDISTLGLRDLRESMCMIPQDPFLFSGTLRENIDPFNAVQADKDVWDALEMVGLKGVVGALPEGLATVMSDGGGNFSQGQRQLICMARALLRKARILMLDEATASIDLETDNKIQAAIRTAFSHCTVLTIAHRLDTVMDSDRIIVMEKGVVAEIDAPKTLLDNKDGVLSHLVSRSGNADRLKSIASKSFENLRAIDTKRFLP